MSIARIASLVHKWLALLIGIQILFWVVSGLFFTLYPIEQIRSEHLIRETTPRHVDAAALAPLEGIRNDAGQAPVRLSVENRASGQVVFAEFASGAAELYDAATLQRLSPLDETQAIRIARDHVTIASAPTGAERVTENTPEYGGAVPAWRVQFPDYGLAVYVAENTGLVTARRSDLWRIYDALWALHIMDWENHEDFNHPLIIIVAWLTLFSVIAGIALIPYRFRWRKPPTG